MRDQYTRVAQSQLLGKISLRKTWRLLLNIFHNEECVAFSSQLLGSSWSPTWYVLSLNWCSYTKHGLGMRGENCPIVGLEDTLGVSQKPSGDSWHILPDSEEASYQTNQARLFTVNQVFQSFSYSCGFSAGQSSTFLKPIHQNCWNPDSCSPHSIYLVTQKLLPSAFPTFRVSHTKTSPLRTWRDSLSKQHGRDLQGW